MPGNEIKTKASQGLDTWRKGEKLGHDKLNQVVRAVNRMLGADTPEQVDPKTRSHLAIQQFKVKTIYANVLGCMTWDGTTEGTVEIYVAKPFLLRQSPFDGLTHNGISYAYSSPSLRTATRGANSETQIIIPVYVVDDIIYGLSSIVGGTATNVSGVPVQYLDLNVDGRAWAKQ